MEFKKYKISDVAEVIGGGTPSTKKAEYYGSDIPWITPKDLSNHKKRYITYGERSITNLGLQKSSAKLLPTNTVLFTSRAPIGYVAIAGNQISTNQGFKSLICNENLILPEYMYYLMKFSTPDIENLATGSTFKEVSGSIIKNFEIELPNIIEQEKIINILSSLDSKIELNLDIIHNLEKISQTLFKHWFIDFEFPNEEGKPYKSSGGEMVGCALDRIPINWENTNLKYLSKNIFAGGTPNRKEESYWTNPEIPWLKTKEITNNFILNTEEYISLEGLKNSSAKWANPNSIVIAMYGATAGRVGYIANKLTTNQASCVIETNYPNYVWSYLKKNQEHIKTMATGSAQQNLNKSVISNLKIPHPGNELLELYEAFVSPNTELCINLCKENDNLQQLRDTLLPKLLSGEIEIPDELEV